MTEQKAVSLVSELTEWWLCPSCLNAFEDDPGRHHMADDEGQDPDCGTQPVLVRAVAPMKRWRRMQQVEINPQAIETHQSLHPEYMLQEAWANDVYDCMVYYLEGDEGWGRRGSLHLSIKRLDREAAHDWRHLQAIKNEVAGKEREALELYPAESRLVDGANQTHLYVFREGTRLPFGFTERMVSELAESVKQTRGFNVDTTKMRQRPWQPGLTTGLGQSKK